MKRILSFIILSLVFIVWFACYVFASSKSVLPDSFIVEVIPNEFTIWDAVDLKITAMRKWEVFESYEWYYDITVMDDNHKILQVNEVTIPDWWWWNMFLKDKGVKFYEKWLIIEKAGNFKVLVSEFTDDSIYWDAKITVKWKPASQTTTNTKTTINTINTDNKTNQTKAVGETKIVTDNNEHKSSLNNPDSFKVELSNNKVSTDEFVNITISAIKDWKVLQEYEWAFNITVYDHNWKSLTSSDMYLYNWWNWEIKWDDKWVKTYKNWLKIKKAGKFKIEVVMSSDGSISWKSSIEVTVPTTSKKTVQSNDDIILMLNKKWVTIHKTWQDFKPNKNVRRDEAAKMLSVASKTITNKSNLTPAASCSFNDLDDAWADLRDVVKESCKLWLFKWSNNKFNPANSITNAQLLTVVWRMLYWMQDETWEHYAKPYIDKLTKDWYLSDMNLTKSDWNNQAKRWDIAKLLAKVLK